MGRRAFGMILVALGSACTRSSETMAHKDPTASVDTAPVDATPAEEIFSVVDIVREFEKDPTAAHARWGWSTTIDGGIRAHHAPFLVSGRLVARDELMSGLDKVRFGDPEKGVAWCFVMYITKEMKLWPRDKIVVARAMAVRSATAGDPGATPPYPPHIHLDCEFIETANPTPTATPLGTH